MKMRAPPPVPPRGAPRAGQGPGEARDRHGAATHPDGLPDDEARAIAERYARRESEASAKRYGLFDAAALQAMQERQRLMVVLWRRHGWSGLAGLDILEVGCGAGGILLELLRMGAQPARLAGIELLPERAAKAHAVLPPAVRVLQADARHAGPDDASQDMVLAFTVFSSILDDAVQRQLAARMWAWLRPGGGVMVHDFCVDNPRNADVRAVPVERLRLLFPAARMTVRRATLAPPLARACARLHPRAPALVNALMPLLRSHRLCWLAKPDE